MERNFTQTVNETITLTNSGGNLPYWTTGRLVDAPTVNTVIHTHQCTSGKTTSIIGFYIDTTDVMGNRFIIRWKHKGVEYVRTLTTSSLGTVNSEGFAISGQRPADPQSQITIEVARASTSGSVYYAAFLLQEVLIR